MEFSLVPVTVQEVDRRGEEVLRQWAAAWDYRKDSNDRDNPASQDPDAVKYMRTMRYDYIGELDVEDDALRGRLPVQLMPMAVYQRNKGKDGTKRLAYDSAFLIAAYNAKCLAIHMMLEPFIRSGAVIESTSQHGTNYLTEFPNSWWVNLGNRVWWEQTVGGGWRDHDRAALVRVLGLAQYEYEEYHASSQVNLVPTVVYSPELFQQQYIRVIAEFVKVSFRVKKSRLNKIVDLGLMKAWKPKMSPPARMTQTLATFMPSADVGLWPEFGKKYSGYQPDLDTGYADGELSKLLLLATYLSGYMKVKHYHAVEQQLMGVAAEIVGETEEDPHIRNLLPRVQAKLISWLAYRPVPADMKLMEHYDDETGAWLGKWYDLGVDNWERRELAETIRQQAVAVVPPFSLGSWTNFRCPVCGGVVGGFVLGSSRHTDVYSNAVLVWTKEPDVPDTAYHLLCSGLMLDPSDELPAVVQSKKLFVVALD